MDDKYDGLNGWKEDASSESEDQDLVYGDDEAIEEGAGAYSMFGRDLIDASLETGRRSGRYDADYAYYVPPKSDTASDTRSENSRYDEDPRYAKPKRNEKKKENKGAKKDKPGFGRRLLAAIALGLAFGLAASTVMVAVNSLVKHREAQTTDAVEETVPQFTVNIVKTSAVGVETTEAQDVSDIVEEVMPSIVAVNTTIESVITDWFGHQYRNESQGAGSGVIFSESDGKLYLITNYHVVEDAKTVSVQFIDETSAAATVMGYDENKDIAVLNIDMSELNEVTRKMIAVAVMGDSSVLRPGESAIAIGNALGYGQSVTTGVISAVERDVAMTDASMKVIQTSAAINPGNSGGALLNGHGEVVGINYMKYSTTDVEGMGFAIPINDVIEIATGIIDGTIVAKTDDTAAYLGITGGTLSEDVASNYGAPAGVYVSNVANNSAAQRAGLQSGCIITEFKGQEVKTMEELQAAIAECAPGEEVVMIAYFNRGGQYKPYELRTILGSRSEADLTE